MIPVLLYFIELNYVCYPIHTLNLKITVISFHIYDKKPNLNFYLSSWCCDSKIFAILVLMVSYQHRVFLNSTTGYSLRHGLSLSLEINDSL